MILSSDANRYGGQGTPPLDSAGRWHIPGAAAIVLAPRLTEGIMNSPLIRQAWTQRNLASPC